MTELETLQRAKMYLEKLANGVNPLTDAPVAEQDVVNHVRVSRCLFYVCGVLDRAIESERRKKSKDLPAFQIDIRQLAAIKPFGNSVQISVLVNRINQFIDRDMMKPLAASMITSWLLEIGILESREGIKGRKPTKKGEELGLTTEPRQGPNGDYLAVFYSPAAQQFILDNLPAVLDRRHTK